MSNSYERDLSLLSQELLKQRGGQGHLLLGQLVGPGPEHLVFVLDAQLRAAFFVNTLLPQQVLELEGQRLRRHFG